MAQATFQGSMAGIILALAIYVQNGLGFSAMSAGLVLLPFSLGAFVGIWWLARIVVDQGNDLGTWGLWTPMGLAGIGLGLLVVPLIDIALSTVSSDDAGAASGTFSTFQQLGGALGIAVIGAVFFNAVGDAFSPAALRDGLVAASWWSVGGYLVCAASTLLLPDRRTVHEAARQQEELLNA